MGFLASCAIACGQNAALPEAQAQSVRCPKPPVLDTKQVDALNAADSEKLDVFALLATQPTKEAWSPETAVFMVKSALARLYYTVSFERLAHPSEDSQFCSELVAFERAAQLTPDGTLSLGEFTRLMTLSATATETNLVLPAKLVIGDGSSYVSAEGTWVMKDEKIAWPINHSQIWCWRQERSCSESSSTVSSGTDTDGSPSYVNSSETRYDITSWTAEKIEARSEALCAETKLTLNVKTKAVFSVTSQLDKPTCLGANGERLVPLSNPPHLSTLEDGFDVSRRFYEARAESVRKVYPAAVRDLLSRLRPVKSQP